MGEPAVHAPLSQLSETVQGLPSSQLEPSGSGGLLQTPVAGSQRPGPWHWSEAAHAMGSAPTQLPARQLSEVVQRLPSLHDSPSGFAGFEHAPVSGLHSP